jgi:hypothetical protein
MHYEVQRTTRHCAVNDREFAPGETFYSILKVDSDEVIRLDYSAEAWQDGQHSEGQQLLGWWKTRLPDRTQKRKHWAPNDVMLHFFDRLGDEEENEDTRYVLALLMVRRRIFRLEELIDDSDDETISVYCPRRSETYSIRITRPPADRVEAIQEELAELLQ